MEFTTRPPTKAEALLAVVLSLVAASFFGSVAAFLWFSGLPSSPISKAIFTVLFLASVVLLIRAAFSSRRALSLRESTALAWAMVILGSCGAVAALLLTSDWGRGSLLASSLSGLAFGLVGLSGPRR